MNAALVARLPGFRDFAPGDLAVRHHIFEKWREVAGLYGFQEYDGPPLEPFRLYAEKSGPEIAEQLYEFMDKGGRRVAMRPEMTPTLARILAERSRSMAKPLRWFSIPQLFRYERSQRGRLREHFQLNADIAGEAGVAADAEVLALAIDAARALGLTSQDFSARVNDRRLVNAVLDALEIPTDARLGVLDAVDKAGRAGAERTEERLKELGLGASAAAGVLEAIGDGSWEALHQRFARCDEVLRAMEPLAEHRSILDAMGLGEYVCFDFAIVRGLAYYTGIVFELFDRAGEFRAICGGGRYDRLLERVGGEELPAVGFGMGDVVLAEILRSRGLLPRTELSCDCYVAWVGEEQREAGLRAARQLRDGGLSVLYSLRPRGLGKQLKEASRAGAASAVIIGAKEVLAGTVTVREMRSGRQQSVPLGALARALAHTPASAAASAAPETRISGTSAPGAGTS